jgi:hypothetical protein
VLLFSAFTLVHIAQSDEFDDVKVDACPALSDYARIFADNRDKGVALDDVHMVVDHQVNIPSLRIILHQIVNCVYDSPGETPSAITTKFNARCEKGLYDRGSYHHRRRYNFQYLNADPLAK